MCQLDSNSCNLGKHENAIIYSCILYMGFAFTLLLSYFGQYLYHHDYRKRQVLSNKATLVDLGFTHPTKENPNMF